MRKLVGCRKQCSFCRAPCYYENENHAFQHGALQHRPLGVIGFKWRKTNELVTHNCQSVKKSDLRQSLDEKIFVSPNEENKDEKDWKITSDSNMQSSLYWKWFMNKFNKELADHFKAKPGQLPSEWADITWEDAKKSLSTSKL